MLQLCAFAAALQRREDGIGKVAEFLCGFLTRLARGFIDRLQQIVPALGRHLLVAKKIRPEFAVADPDDKIFLGESKFTQEIDAKRNQFDIGGEIAFADDVAIELKMFAQPAALLFFVSEKLSDREPFERFLEFAFMRRDHASKRGRELRAQRDFAFAFVSEIEKLLDNFRAALFLVQLGRFERRAFPFDKAIAPGDLAPAREDIIAPGAVVGQEIAKTG